MFYRDELLDAAAEAHVEFFDSEFPEWRDSESDPERFVSESDYYGFPQLSAYDEVTLMTENELKAYDIALSMLNRKG